MAENILLLHTHTHIYIYLHTRLLCNNDHAVAVAATADAATARHDRLRKSRKSSPFSRGVFRMRKMSVLIYILFPNGNSHPFSRVDMCVRAPSVWVCVYVRVSPFVGGKETSASVVEQPPPNPENAILIRSERSGR